MLRHFLKCMALPTAFFCALAGQSVASVVTWTFTSTVIYYEYGDATGWCRDPDYALRNKRCTDPVITPAGTTYSGMVSFDTQTDTFLACDFGGSFRYCRSPANELDNLYLTYDEDVQSLDYSYRDSSYTAQRFTVSPQGGSFYYSNDYVPFYSSARFSLSSVRVEGGPEVVPVGSSVTMLATGVMGMILIALRRRRPALS